MQNPELNTDDNRKSEFISRHLEDLWNLITSARHDKDKPIPPLDRILAAYYREHRYLGSKDRRLLSEGIYARVRSLPWPEPLAPYRTPYWDSPAPVCIRANALLTTREALQTQLKELGIISTPTTVSPDGLILDKRYPLQTLAPFKDGLFEVQDEASQLIGLIANPPRDGLILDACAGAGGKSLHLAALIENRGKILASDIRPLDELSRRAKRAGAHSITCITSPNALSPYRGQCDLVLVDAPCSSSGTIRRNPDLRWRISDEIIAHYSELQAQIIEHSAIFVKPGGTLVYATCSFMPQENEASVCRFLSHHPEFSTISIPNHPPGLSKPVDDAITGEGYFKSANVPRSWDGFFVASMRLSL